MKTNRREFLKYSAKTAALGVVGAAALNEPAQAGASKTGKASLKKKDDTWWSYVESGFYPARTHLFFDDHYIYKMKGLTKKVELPVRVSDEPVMKVEKPWEGMSLVFRNGITYDKEEKLFKFWYSCFDPSLRATSVMESARSRWAYATSTDGLHWERPELGLVEYKGSKKNNIISYDLPETHALFHSVIKDNRDENPQRRYKAIANDAHPLQPGEQESPDLTKDSKVPIAGGLFAAYSPDGLRWKVLKRTLCGQAVVRDGSVLHGYSERYGKWILWQRAVFRRGVRTIGVSFSEDFERWTLPEFGLAPDDQDPKGIEFDAFNTVESSDGGFIGLLSVSGWTGKGFSSGDEVPQLAYARDPRVWTRVYREPWIPQGARGSWDEGCIITANPIVVGDDIFLYYYGKNRGKIWGDPTYDGKSITASALGLAKLKRDRWVAITANGGSGEMTTNMIFFANNEVHINADAKGGSIRAEIVDFSGKPLYGYTIADCDPVTGDSLDHTISWKGKSNIARAMGTAINWGRIGRGMRLRFKLENAKLYSFSC